MKQLHFERRGRMHVADEGQHRFVLHSLPPDEAILRWVAEVHKLGGKRVRRLAKEAHATKAQALDWLARYR